MSGRTVSVDINIYTVLLQIFLHLTLGEHILILDVLC